MAAHADRPDRKTTRRTFLVAGACALAALAVGRRLTAPWTRVARPRRADGLTERVTPDGLELRPTPVRDDGPVFRLNRTAALVWRSVDGRRDVADIAALVAATYRVPQARVQRDTNTCLRLLAAQGLVVDLPGGGSTQVGPA